ncbi:MAG: hypothetical protein M1836_005207 [Candelina mexicana]|nr:MAG: hypothetical protein M1836_005207 [Candelina mexicana]
MAPDLNSLPPSHSRSQSPLQTRVLSTMPETAHRQTPSPSPRSSSMSLAAAASINAGIQHQDSRRSSSSSTNRNRGGAASPQAGRHEHRRSNVIMNLHLNDPELPGPGELQGSEHRTSTGHSFTTASPQSIGGSPTVATGDPHHHRAPSLGEIHQELEQEQEAHVNRLLQMIRLQQAQLQQAQQQQSTAMAQSTAVDDSTPTSERSFSFPAVPPTTIANPRPRSPAPRSSFDLSRRSSQRSRASNRSPALRPVSAGLTGHSDEQGWLLGGSGSRDESAYYQAETQTLTRENQMLRMRIRELERQVSDLNPTPSNTHAPATVSNLTAPPLEAEEGRASLGIGNTPDSAAKDD